MFCCKTEFHINRIENKHIMVITVQHKTPRHITSTYINTKMCVFLRVFLGHLESDGIPFGTTLLFSLEKGYNTKIYLIGALID